jgi:hypothetical protein
LSQGIFTRAIEAANRVGNFHIFATYAGDQRGYFFTRKTFAEARKLTLNLGLEDPIIYDREGREVWNLIGDGPEYHVPGFKDGEYTGVVA